MWKARGTGRIAITAFTGAASVAFPGGRTLHSWAGIGQGTLKAKLLLEDIQTKKELKAAKKRWRQTDCLLIDESQFGRPLIVHHIKT